MNYNPNMPPQSPDNSYNNPTPNRGPDSPDQWRYDPETGQPISRTGPSQLYDPITGEPIPEPVPQPEPTQIPPQYGQPIPPQYQYPAPNPNAPETPEEKAKADKICWGVVIANIASIAIGFIIGMIGTLTDTLDEAHPIMFGIYGLFAVISRLVTPASVIAIIYVRIKYPKNTFGKVLMWIAIIMAILAVIAGIIMIIACLSCINEFSGGGGILYEFLDTLRECE